MAICEKLKRMVDRLNRAETKKEIVEAIQGINAAILRECLIKIGGCFVKPVWVECYYYRGGSMKKDGLDESFKNDFGSDPFLWKDGSCHKKPEQRNRFGMLYFHSGGNLNPRRGGVDLVLSDKDDFCLSFLVRRSFLNRGGGNEKSKIIGLEETLCPLMKGKPNMVVLTEKKPESGAEEIEYVRRVNVNKGDFAAELLGAYDKRFCCGSGFRKKPLLISGAEEKGR
ncbi:MAG: hypothetical protein LKK13_04785 [Bacilli bacterium]|nr:hypothetical protein [Bacilli bacterium]